MTTTSSGRQKGYVFAGIAGETAPGFVIKSGLYRLGDGDDDWESLTKGLPEAPAIRAIAIHPKKPEVVYVGTQEGPYRSSDHGDHWEKVEIPDHGLPVWSLLFHPGDPRTMYAGYESCEIYSSKDEGESWRQLPVGVRFPEVTMAPGANPAKRVLMMSASIADPGVLYGALEVGGVIRSLDGGRHWENLSHGLYLDEEPVDTHGVVASNWRPGVVFSITGVGLFRSIDHGEHWLHIPLEPLDETGHLYTRAIREVPGDPKTIWAGAGADFDSDVGGLYRSTDGGMEWERVNMGLRPASPVFCIAFNERHPTHMCCAAFGGEVFVSDDSGESWNARPLPDGVSQVYALASG